MNPSTDIFGPVDYERLFQASSTPELILSPAWVIVAVNDAYLQVAMTRREDVLGHFIFDVFPDSSDGPTSRGVRNLSSSLARAMINHTTDVMSVERYDVARPAELGGGFEERWWNMTNSPVFDERGQVIYVSHRVDDVSAFVQQRHAHDAELAVEDALALWRRAKGLESEMFLRAQERQAVNVHLSEADEALRESEASFRAMADVAPVLMWMAGPDKRCIWFNRRWLDFTGRTLEQEIGHGWTEGIHPDDAERCGTIYDEALDSRQPLRIEYRLRRCDGSYRWILDLAAPSFANGEVLGYIGAAIDIDDQKRLEAALRDSMYRLQRFYDSGLVGVICWTMDGRVTDANDKFLAMIGYLNRLTGLTNQELQHQTSLLTIQKEDRPLAAATMKEAFDNGYAQAELNILTRDRGVRHFFMSARRFQVGDATYLVGIGADTTDRRAKMKALEHEAHTDALTQVANRGRFLEVATQELARCRRFGHPLSLWMLDVDHFKDVNDTYGHQAGDVALQSLMVTSRQALRDWDTMGRMGGEEFAVLLPETDATQALQVAERLRQAVAATDVPIKEGKVVHLTVSTGIATAGDDDTTVETLLDRADKALYEAKRTGRDRVCVAGAY